ncbi:formyltransferase family protein [Natrialbaceae archaeon A-gly3]
MRCQTACVLLESDFLPDFQASALQTLTDRTAVEISLVVVNDDPCRLRDRSLEYLLERARSWGPWLPVWAGAGLSRAITGPPAYDERRHYSTVDALADADVVRCSPEWEDDVWRSIPDPVADEIAAEADVAIRFGFGLLTGRILEALECGVLSFHYGDIREHRGCIGGLWEFLEGERSAGVTLQQLTDQIDGGRIVAVDHVPVYDHDTYGAIKRRQRTSILGELLVEGVQNLNDPDFDPVVPDSLGVYRSAPTTLEVLRYLRKNTVNRLRRGFSSRGDVVAGSRRGDLSRERTNSLEEP